MDYVVDNTDVMREINRLKKEVGERQNIKVLYLHSFEYILLSLDFLIDWIYAQEDSFREKRKDYINDRILFLDIDLLHYIYYFYDILLNINYNILKIIIYFF